MAKGKKKKKYGIIPAFKAPWEPHGHSRGGGGVGGRIRDAGGRGGCGCGRGGCCGPFGICIVILILMLFFGGMLPGFLGDGGLPADGDDDPVRYYQLTVLVTLDGGDFFMAHDIAYSPVLFHVDVYPMLGGMIEAFTMYENVLGKSAYDYVEGYGLYVEIYNDALEYYTDGYIVSGVDNSFTMYQNDDSDVGSVTIDWISNGAGTRW